MDFFSEKYPCETLEFFLDEFDFFSEFDSSASESDVTIKLKNNL